uniref:Uncharacterized protein n=1 Tax=Solanum lycopersicum TaxID=4081 RepID=A0A3Q7JBB7_SOLLC
MSQQETSKRTKKAKKKTFAKPGSLSFLANKKRLLLTTNEIIKEIECEKGHLLKLIGAEQSVAPQSEAKRQSVEKLPFENQPIEELPVVQPVEELPLEQHGKDFTFEDQVQMNSFTPRTNDQPKEQDVTTPNKIGRTQMHDVHARKERKLIILNSQNQPVGPTDDVVIELSSFLGTLARNATLCPFDILDWRSMDTKKDLWYHTKGKYIIPEVAYHWAMVKIRDAWRRHRSNLKLNYYDPYDNDTIRMAKKPGHIPECQFRELLKYWNSEKFKKMSETNAMNRKKLMNPHTAGKKSFALVRNKLPEMEEIQKQISINDEYVDAFSSVMGHEHPGRLTLYGAGVTKTTLKKKVGNLESILSATTDGMQQMQEKMQKMEKQMEEQKKIVRQEVIVDVIAQLKHAGLIYPNILEALSTPSPRESTFVQGAKQGDEIEEGDESSSEDLT